MKAIDKFSGKILGSIKKIQVTEQSNVDVFNEPSSGIVFNNTITYVDESVVYNLFGTMDASGFNSAEEITDHGIKFSPVVSLSIPKLESDKGDNLEEMLRKPLFVLVFDNNGNTRIMGTKQEHDDVTCIIAEATGEAPLSQNKYSLSFVWECSHQPYFYTGTNVLGESEESDEGGE